MTTANHVFLSPSLGLHTPPHPAQPSVYYTHPHTYASLPSRRRPHAQHGTLAHEIADNTENSRSNNGSGNLGFHSIPPGRHPTGTRSIHRDTRRPFLSRYVLLKKKRHTDVYITVSSICEPNYLLYIYTYKKYKI